MSLHWIFILIAKLPAIDTLHVLEQLEQIVGRKCRPGILRSCHAGKYCVAPLLTAPGVVNFGHTKISNVEIVTLPFTYITVFLAAPRSCARHGHRHAARQDHHRAVVGMNGAEKGLRRKR
jgi:hypothetical protein